MHPRTHCIRAGLVLLGAAFVQSALAADKVKKAGPEFGNPTFANPDTPGLLAGKPAEAANVSDVVFLKQLSIGNRAESELGKLANERGELGGVKTFGQHMTRDHDKANSRLTSVARSAGVDLPKDLDAEHEAARGELGALRGSAFDQRYVESQMKDHQKAAQLLIYVIGSGQHTGTKQYAMETLPTVMEHLEGVRGLHAQLTGTMPTPRGGE